jgi:hypothetical protein
MDGFEKGFRQLLRQCFCCRKANRDILEGFDSDIAFMSTRALRLFRAACPSAVLAGISRTE